jgi:hypothetical protein
MCDKIKWWQSYGYNFATIFTTYKALLHQLLANSLNWLRSPFNKFT